VPLASGGGAGEEGGATALGKGEGRPAMTVPREGEGRPATRAPRKGEGRPAMARASAREGSLAFSLRVGSRVCGRAGRWASGGGELALRNDHNTLGRIKSTKIAILGRHQRASASVRKRFMTDWWDGSIIDTQDTRKFWAQEFLKTSFVFGIQLIKREIAQCK
jgi:hypothetical protein